MIAPTQKIQQRFDWDGTDPPGDRQKALGYDITRASHRRQRGDSRLAGEDFFQRGQQRRWMMSQPRDAIRNITLLGWAIRRHLDFVVDHSIGFRLKDRGLKRDLLQWVAEREQRQNFDVRRQHNRQRFFRFAEARKILDGDLAAIKLRSRHLQAIESDRIWNPPGATEFRFFRSDRLNWVNGIRVDSTMRRRELGIYRRTARGGVTEFERTLNFDRVIFFEWYNSHYRFDAVRGVGPITSSLDDFIDVEEGKDHATSKLKVAQMMGIIIKSALGEGAAMQHDGGEVITDPDDEDGEYVKQFWADMGSGPAKFEVDQADDVQILDPKTGATEVVSLLDWCVAIAIKSLDLPINFYDESRTNFFGSKAGVTMYRHSTKPKQRDVQEDLRHWLEWQIDLAASPAIREIVPPRGVDLDDIKRSATFTPRGLPMFDKSREVAPTIESLKAGVDTWTNVVADYYGADLDDHLAQMQADNEAFETFGLEPFGGATDAEPIQVQTDPEDDDPDERTDEDVEDVDPDDPEE